MPEIVRLYHLPPSPNNMKARIALAYKGIPYEAIRVDGQDRAEVVRLSGQPLTPVLVHGDRVVFDSGAILRYLEANFRDTPPLFSDDYPTMKKIERWEATGRRELSEPVSIVFRQFFAPQVDEIACARAGQMLQERTAALEEALAGRDWLVADRMTAADVTIAPMVHYGMVEDVSVHPVASFFRDHLKLGPGRDRTRGWVRRVMAYDR